MEERCDCVDRLMHDQLIEGTYNILIDVSQVSNSPTSEEMHSIVSLIEKMNSKFGGRLALVNTHVGHVTITDLIALSACGGSDDVRAFMIENEARAWLRATTN